MSDSTNTLIGNDQHLSILNLIPNPVYYVDSNYIFKYANPEYEKWLGVSSKSLVGLAIFDVLAENHYEKINARVAEALSGNKVEFETVLDLPYKKNISIKAIYTPDTDIDGTVRGYLAMLYDITEKVQIERALQAVEDERNELNVTLEQKVKARTIELELKNEELKESVERYHRMIEEVEDYAIILMDKDGFILDWNKGAQKIKGYTEAEILGKNFRIFYMPEDQQRGLPEQLINEARLTGRAIHEGWRVTKSGSRFWGSIVITALHDEDNNVTGFTKVTRNLTDKKLAEDRLRQYAETLEAQNKELEQFTYIASHDMKEPLRKIILYNNMVRDKAKNKLDEKEQEYFERATNAANRMQKLIEDLLAYSKTSFIQEDVQLLDLNSIVSDIAEFYKEKLDETDGEITIGNLPEINGIAFQVRQLFDNLIGNAIKYQSPDRSPRISITHEKVNAASIGEPELLADNGKAVTHYHKISVADNGIGFSEEYSQKVFELFQRLVTKDMYSGNGIGLSICKKIVQNHHGHIEATSNEGKGAVFSVYFPA